MVLGQYPLFSVVCLLLAFSRPVWADKPLLPVATEHYPPYEMQEAVDGLRGFDYELLTVVLDRMGYRADIQFLPWKRALSYTEYGKVAGLLTCAHRTERERFILYSDPISSFTSGFYSRVEQDSPDIHELNDIVGFSVASVAGYESLQELEDIGARPQQAPTTESAIKMLRLARFDYLYVGQETTDFQIKQLGLAGQFEFHPIKKSRFYFCFSRAYPDVESLHRRFNRVLSQVIEEGTAGQIRAKYR